MWFLGHKIFYEKPLLLYSIMNTEKGQLSYKDRRGSGDEGIFIDAASMEKEALLSSQERSIPKDSAQIADPTQHRTPLIKDTFLMDQRPQRNRRVEQLRSRHRSGSGSRKSEDGSTDHTGTSETGRQRWSVMATEFVVSVQYTSPFLACMLFGISLCFLNFGVHFSWTRFVLMELISHSYM